jgi:hypothetical protein
MQRNGVDCGVHIPNHGCRSNGQWRTFVHNGNGVACSAFKPSNARACVVVEQVCVGSPRWCGKENAALSHHTFNRGIPIEVQR